MTTKGEALFAWMNSSAERMAEFNRAYRLWYSQLSPFQGKNLFCCQFAGELAGHIALSQNKTMEEALTAAKERFEARHVEWTQEDDEEDDMD